MAADQRTKAEKDLRDSAREIERKKAELQDDSNAKRQEEMNKLQRLLFGEVREYAKAQNYDIVIAEGVLYATPTVDITAAVLNVLKAQARRPPPAPAAGSQAAREALRENGSRPGRTPTAMTVTLGELAVRFGCELRGDPAAVGGLRRRAVAGGSAIGQLSRQSQVRRAARGDARGCRHPGRQVGGQPRRCRC